MVAFLAIFLSRLARRDAFWTQNGFYLAVGFYGAQRFVWEFIKPYGPIVGPFSVFHFLSAALVVYAASMLWTGAPSGARATINA
jgi:phosphatidylglycerol---prolipoprotein diacylglyceryl transferase